MRRSVRAEAGRVSEVTTPAVPVLGPTHRIPGGWRVHSADRFHVDILRMLGANFRLVTTPVDQPLTYTRAWCYQRPLVEVVLAAVALDPDGDDEPVGWIKQVGTERRACGWLRRSRLQKHAGFDPQCPDCGNAALA